MVATSVERFNGFHAQPRHLAEVGQILRHEQSIVRKRDGRDSQIHPPGAHLQSEQALKLYGGVLIEVEHRACGEIVEQFMKSVRQSE
jgi:hypothetical protein